MKSLLTMSILSLFSMTTFADGNCDLSAPLTRSEVGDLQKKDMETYFSDSCQKSKWNKTFHPVQYELFGNDNLDHSDNEILDRAKFVYNSKNEAAKAHLDLALDDYIARQNDKTIFQAPNSHDGHFYDLVLAYKSSLKVGFPGPVKGGLRNSTNVSKAPSNSKSNTTTK